MIITRRITIFMLLAAAVILSTFELSGTAYASQAHYTQLFNRVGYPNNELCLGIVDGSTSKGAQAIIWACNGNGDQAWSQQFFDSNPNSNFRLVNKKSGMCLGLPGGTTAQGAFPIQWPCNNNLDQEWDVEPTGTLPYLNLVNQNSKLCLGVLGVVQSDTNPIQWACNNHNDQQWVNGYILQ